MENDDDAGDTMARFEAALERYKLVSNGHHMGLADEQAVNIARHELVSLFAFDRAPPGPGVRLLMEGIADEFERTIQEAERLASGGGGMHVPFHGDFAAAVRLPSVVSRMRWWVREFRRALAEEHETQEGKEG